MPFNNRFQFYLVTNLPELRSRLADRYKCSESENLEVFIYPFLPRYTHAHTHAGEGVCNF